MRSITGIGLNLILALLGAIFISTGLHMLDSFTGLVSLLIGLFFILLVVRWVWKTWFAR